MTDDTETAASSAQFDRIAQLRAKRAQTAPLPHARSTRGSTAPTAAGPGSSRRRRRRRRHVARGSRIVAAGLGVTTMFGIVGVLGLDNPFVAAKESVPTLQPVAALANLTEPPAAASTPPVPIVLTANPVVQTVTAAAPIGASSPAVTTRGSK